MDFNLSLDELQALLPQACREGSTAARLVRVAALEQAGPGDLSFLGNPKYQKAVPTSRASVILLPPDYVGTPGADQAYLRLPRPSAVLAALCRRWLAEGGAEPPSGIHSTAVVDPTAQVDPSAAVGPGCVLEAGVVVGPRTVLRAQVFLGRGARVGAECLLHPQVVVYEDCQLGDRVILHAGVVVGSDGFGYETVEGRHEKVPQIGRVVVEDEVEIGANTTIDRARFEETRLGRGSKIDNLVQIAHNVRLGPGCLMAAQSGISGSTEVGSYVMVGGQAGLGGHLKIGSGSVIGGQAGISKDLPAKSFVTDTPAYPLREAYRVEALKRRLPELFERLAALEHRLGTPPH